MLATNIWEQWLMIMFLRAKTTIPNGGRSFSSINLRGSVEPIFILELMVILTKYIHCCFGITSVLILIAAKTVELIKREIAKRHANDLDAYYDIKDPVYDLIWDAALEWSRYTGWKPE